MAINHTDKATLAGLYLATFDRRALAALGCSGVWQAFNILGYSLEAGPASIKNYRDEFDHEIRKTNPCHPREGWKRPLKNRSKKLYDSFSSLGFDEFTDLVKGFLVPSYEKENLISSATKQIFSLNLAQRLMTGQAAEAYFKMHCPSIPVFSSFGVEDVTSCGCGYDFHLSFQSSFYCVEVKGLGTNTGSISMTEKEYAVANEVQERYCLFVVRNFQKSPTHSFFFNPVKSSLSFTPQMRTVTSYMAYL
jgi:hypothetical protein